MFGIFTSKEMLTGENNAYIILLHKAFLSCSECIHQQMNGMIEKT